MVSSEVLMGLGKDSWAHWYKCYTSLLAINWDKVEHIYQAVEILRIYVSRSNLRLALEFPCTEIHYLNPE